ncbi:uncharacterized protein [Mytilus edulis]|uniref:uncharacterized protein n=1 Tax=Mytilus edulis TaxID=6550 RepID=UPI0039EE8C18
MGVPGSKEFHARMKSDYSNNDLDVQQKSLNMGIFNNCSCFDTEVNTIIPSRKKDLDPIEPKLHDVLIHSRSLSRPLPQLLSTNLLINPSTSETIHNTHNAPADTIVSHKKKEAHTLQQCSLETSFRKENKDKVEVKNKKRKRKKRKPEGFKTSLNSRKATVIGDDSELVHSAGYIIHCLTDRRLSKTVCEAGKIGTIYDSTFDFRIKKNVYPNVNK